MPLPSVGDKALQRVGRLVSAAMENPETRRKVREVIDELEADMAREFIREHMTKPTR